MQAVGDGRARLKLFGKRDLRGDEAPLSAGVFARKVLNLISSLSAADSVVNGKRTFDFVIVDLQKGSGLIEVEETPFPKARFRSYRSAVEGLDTCADAIYSGSYDEAIRWGQCVDSVAKLPRGYDKAFGFGELWFSRRESPFRLDSFFSDQTNSAIAERDRQLKIIEPPKWYAGNVHGSFVGDLLEVDFRGSLPLGKLVLSAGGKEIDCIFREEDVEIVRDAARQKVRISGLARYDGKSGLPRRIDVATIKQMHNPGDISKWKGSFAPFDVGVWDVD